MNSWEFMALKKCPIKHKMNKLKLKTVYTNINEQRLL